MKCFRNSQKFAKTFTNLQWRGCYVTHDDVTLPKMK